MIANLEESLRLLRQVNAERIREAELRERAERTGSGGTTRSGGTSTASSGSSSGGMTTTSRAPALPTGGVTINIAGDALDAESLARKIMPALDRINRLRA
ncbi:MAG: hypothetical protein IPG66_16885 [Hydrogenophilales bacterium]|nr:hypothetical protein [Hydrogenophilales bacterium]